MSEAAGAKQDAAGPVRFTVQFPDRARHVVDIEMNLPVQGRQSTELMMAVWTPGSYLVREYARHVEHFEACDAATGAALAFEKTRKNRWRVSTAGVPELRVRYRVYAREMAVQGNWVDASFALLNGAATFLTPADAAGPRRHLVRVQAPEDWPRVFTGLPDAEGAGETTFVAADFDTLVDCPIYVGNPAVYEFRVDDKPHYLINEGEGGVWDGPRAARDVEAIVRAHRAFWGSLPYDKYLFINILSGAPGGLEHRNSTVLMTSRWATRKRSHYLAWLFLVSHEFFHTWNVKRLRPVELGPFDYENEVYTRDLWIAEGVTSYYDRLLVRRAGLCTVQEFLAGDPPSATSTDDRTRNEIEQLHDTPGRMAQTLAESSFDTWIKFYRRDENSTNSSISYYVKGAVVAWLLDAEIRRASGGAKSLDDVMRECFVRYAGERGFRSEEFQAVARETAGADLQDFFQRALHTVEELDYSRALHWFGLRFAPPTDSSPKDNQAPDTAKAWLGVEAGVDAGRLTIKSMRRDAPGQRAGLNVGDEILAIDELRVPPEQWTKRLEMYQPGDRAKLLIARRERLMTLAVTFDREPNSAWKLEIDTSASDERIRERKRWLNED